MNTHLKLEKITLNCYRASSYYVKMLYASMTSVKQYLNRKKSKGGKKGE